MHHYLEQLSSVVASLPDLPLGLNDLIYLCPICHEIQTDSLSLGMSRDIRLSSTKLLDFVSKDNPFIIKGYSLDTSLVAWSKIAAYSRK